MTDYPFDMQLVVDPLNPSNVVAEGAVYIYAPTDVNFEAPLEITDLHGAAKENPLISSPTGFIDEFVAQIPQVVWKSGVFTGLFNSYKGLKDAADASADAAEASALYAEAVANGMTIGVVTSGSTPAATITGEAPFRQLNFVLPQGEQGEQGPPGSVGTSDLDDLADVDATTPGDGQVLLWSASQSKWIASTPATPPSTLDSLTDVTAASPSDGQVLAWDSALGYWKPVTVSGGASLTQTASYNPTVTGYASSGSNPTFKITVADGTGTAPLLKVQNTGNAPGNPTGIRVDKTGTGNLLALGNSQNEGITHFAVDYLGNITRIANNAVNFTVTDTHPEGSVTSMYGLYIGRGGGWNNGDRPGRLYHKAWHHSYNDGWVAVGGSTDFQTKTANYTLTATDELIIGNGSNLTFTLPSPASIIMGGRIYRIKNIHSTGLTISVGGVTANTIDGATSLIIPQHGSLTVVGTASGWLSLDQRRFPVTVSATAPTAPVTGDVWFDIS